VIRPKKADSLKCRWYGLVLEGPENDFSEIAFTDLAGACHGLMVRNGAPLVRNSVFEFNNVGITCGTSAVPRVVNSVIARNFATGVRIHNANPAFRNNIIAFNRNTGVWSDGASNFTLEYNCIYGNPDGNLHGCDPLLGVLERVNERKDSTDFAHNLFLDPVFAGSVGDSLAASRDVTIPTDRSNVKDTALVKLMHGTVRDSTIARYMSRKTGRYELSRYSPCIDAGHPGAEYKDRDGSRNDMGIWGGKEFVEFTVRRR
jgi:hypothetical protein